MGNEQVRRAGLTTLGFFLPLILAAAFLNAGQSACGCSDETCVTPSAAAAPTASQVPGVAAVDLSATIPTTAEPSRVRFYRDGVEIGAADTIAPSYTQATFTDATGLVAGATHAYTVDYYALPNGIVSYRSQATSVTIVGPDAPTAMSAVQVIGTLDVQVTATVPPGAEALFYRDGTAIGSIVADASGEVELVDSALAVDAVHQYQVTYIATSGGLESQPSASVSVTILSLTFMCGATECERKSANTCFGADECSCGDRPACAFGQYCIDGQCACTSDSCWVGCCDGDACLFAPQGFDMCGANGTTCAPCDPYTASLCSAGLGCFCGFSPACAAGSRCDGGYCACDAESCPNGCCDGNSCSSGQDFPACGTPGSVCTICDADRSDACGAAGECECGGGAQCDEGVLCFEGRCGCQGAECEGGIWSPSDGQTVTDVNQPIDVTVFTLFPRQTVQLQVAINISEEQWVNLGSLVQTPYAPTSDIRGVPIYEVSTQVTVPAEFWVAGSSGWRTNIRAAQNDAPSGFLNTYVNFTGCESSPYYQSHTGEELVTACNYTGKTAARIKTSDYGALTSAPNPPTLVSATCNWIEVSWSGAGTPQYYKNGSGPGIGGIMSAVPGQHYSIRVAKSGSELSTPLEVTAPFCNPPPGLSDGVVDMGLYLVVYEEVASTTPMTAAEAHRITFDAASAPQSFAAYIDEVSRGRSSLSGATYGWSVYSGDTIASLCGNVLPSGVGTACTATAYNNALAHAEDNLPFDAHEFPTTLVYGVSRGGIAGDGGAIFPASTSPMSGYTHETLAHGYGIANGVTHAGGVSCPGGVLPADLSTLSTSCSTHTYADRYDPSGTGNAYHFNAFNLLRYAWLDPAEVEWTSETPGKEMYWLGALLRDTYPTKHLHVPVQGPWHFGLEFRNQDGFNGHDDCSTCDPPIYNDHPPVTGVQIRLSDGGLGTSLLHEGPGTFVLGESAMLLEQGETYVDVHRGISIKVLQMNDDGALVEIAR